MCDAAYRITEPGDIGPLLRELRRAQGVTLADVGTAIDAHETQVCSWERRVILSVPSLIRVSWALGYDVALVRARPGQS